MARLDGIQGRPVQAALLTPTAGASARGRPPQAPFARMLESALLSREPVRFSAHAAERLASRGIEIGPSDHARLNDAVNQAAAKGARESLVIDGELAYVVNVPRRTVITAMPLAQMEQNVFTNIDSAVVVRVTATPPGEMTNSTNNAEHHQPRLAPTWGGPGAAER